SPAGSGRFNAGLRFLPTFGRERFGPRRFCVGPFLLPGPWSGRWERLATIPLGLEGADGYHRRQRGSRRGRSQFAAEVQLSGADGDAGVGDVHYVRGVKPRSIGVVDPARSCTVPYLVTAGAFETVLALYWFTDAPIRLLIPVPFLPGLISSFVYLYVIAVGMR